MILIRIIRFIIIGGVIMVLYKYLKTRKTKIYYGKDGCKVKWVDRETVNYSKGDYSINVWVNFGPRWFTGPQRIINSNSIDKWIKAPEGEDIIIDAETKNRIINSIGEYYKSKKVKYEVE